MPRRKKDKDSKPAKLAQTFFCLDADSEQPICFTTACSARTVTQATSEMLTMAAKILKFNGQMPLVMADNEHYTVELLDWITEASAYDLLVPMPNNSSVRRSIEQIAEQAFTRHWAGYATAKSAYQMKKSKNDSYYQFIQRKGEIIKSA